MFWLKVQIQKGNPEDINGRLEKERRCYELLNKLGIDFDRVDHCSPLS